MAEVLKTGFILDEALSERLRRQILDAASSDLESVVMRCIELKGEVVRDDEFELTGLRAILNFGHTIGHAVEHASGYRGLLHGEAISVGMALEAKLGESLGITQPGTSQIVIQDLERYGLPTKLDGTLRPRDLIETMYRDKKAVEGSLGFSLLTCLGGCKLVRDVPARAVEAVMEQG
jgi:3-dehydroquinate synthase